MFFRHISCDSNGFYNNQVFPKQYNDIIWYFSWLLLLNSMYILRFYSQYYDLAVQPFLVWSTSVMYWRNPLHNSWRRYADMLICFTMGSYQIVRSVTLLCGMNYYIVLSSGILSYFISFYFYTKISWLSLVFHLMLHFAVNVSNIILVNCS